MRTLRIDLEFYTNGNLMLVHFTIKVKNKSKISGSYIVFRAICVGAMIKVINYFARWQAPSKKTNTLEST